MTVVDFKNAEVMRNDPANQAMVNRVAHKTVQMGMFVTDWNAFWAADKFLNVEAYPLAQISFPANRKSFRLQPGDCFRLAYSKYNIDEMVCRVLRIEEESVQSEKIIVHAVEDIYHMGIFPEVGTDVTDGEAQRDEAVDPLSDVMVMESPYILSGDSVEIIAVADREIGIEQGYIMHMSLDESSYDQLGIVTTFGVHGTLVSKYPPDNVYWIDDRVGFQVDFDSPSADIALIESISRAQLIAGHNLCLLGKEIIGVQTITPVSGNRYAFSGIYRGRWDTDPQTHLAGEEFWWIGRTHFGLLNDPAILAGVTRYFKANPYSRSATGNISEASQESLAIQGRAKKPYKPWELTANGGGFYPQYESGEDIVLDWHPRVRGQGAGIGDADTVTDAEPTWEGLFRVEVFVGGMRVRDVTGIDDDTWTYTNAMILTDNGDEPSAIGFRVTNYVSDGGITHYSPPAMVKCYNLSGVDHGTPTTTTTTTTTTTSSTSSSTTTTTTT